MEEFNFCIGRYWNGIDGSVCVYTYHKEIHHGTREVAEKFLEYVKSKNEGKDYKIFVLKEL